MRIIGLTGDIAAGKSTVGRMLEEKGAVLVDADALVHELYADPSFASRVVELFEPHFLDTASGTVRSLTRADGTIDRPALGALVFRDAGALRRLESIVHPAVAELRRRRIEEIGRRNPAPAAIVVEAVKLLESGQAEGCDCIWWVRARPETQLKRMTEARGLSEIGARMRLENQPPGANKQRLAGAVPLVTIENDGSLEELQARVEEEWKRCK